MVGSLSIEEMLENPKIRGKERLGWQKHNNGGGKCKTRISSKRKLKMD